MGLDMSILDLTAVQLSEKAKALEIAAKEGNVDYIRAHHKEALEEYIELTDRIKGIFSNERV